MDNYDIVTKIGKGACGAVYLVTSKKTGRQLALKKVQLDDGKKTRTREALLREAKILATLKHPHIVAYHDSFFAGDEEEHYMHIVQDFCDGGTLDERIAQQRKKKSHFDERTVMEWFIQIAMAVQYIHSHRILHRDLKAQNVFMTKMDGVKLGDFGIAKVLDNTLDAAVTCVGTPCYLSPELCQDIPYSSKADVWALGCLLYEMCALQPAFDAHNLISLFYKIMRAEHSLVPDQYSDQIKSIISLLLSKNPEDRPSAGAILNNPFVRDNIDLFIKDREYLLQQRIISLRVKSSKCDDSQLLVAKHGQSSPSPKVRKSVPHMSRHASSPTTSQPARKSLDDLHNYLSDKSPTSLKSSATQETASSSDLEESPTKENQAKTEEGMNYSDDFDDSESTDDEIPEDLGETSAADVSGPLLTIDNEHQMPTQTLNNDSGEFCGAEEEYDDDFEDDSEAEELDLIVNHAREVHLTELEEDEFFVDTEHNPSTKQLLREHCLEILGTTTGTSTRGQSKVLRSVLELNHAIGTEHTETCYLLEELGESP